MGQIDPFSDNRIGVCRAPNRTLGTVVAAPPQLGNGPSKGTARRWAHHTPSIKALPEHVSCQEKSSFLIGTDLFFDTRLNAASSPALAQNGQDVPATGPCTVDGTLSMLTKSALWDHLDFLMQGTSALTNTPQRVSESRGQNTTAAQPLIATSLGAKSGSEVAPAGISRQKSPLTDGV